MTRHTKIHPIVLRLRSLLTSILPVFVILIVFFINTAPAQQVIRSIDRDTIRTGDQFTYYLRISGVDAYDEILYPDSTQFGPEFIIRDKKVASDLYGDALNFTLQYFGIDDHAVPELRAGLVDGTDTTYLVIPEQPFIYQVRVEDEESELRPLKPIFPFFRNWWPWILATLVLLAIIGYLLYRYRKRLFETPPPVEKPEFTPEPFLNPIDRLREELERIEKAYPDPHTSFRTFYTETGDAFRAYYEHAYRFPALESTTGEVIAELKKRQCDEEVIQILSGILKEADLVKFAKYHPNENECHDVMKNSSSLAERIAATDLPVIEELRREYEERQVEREKQFSVEY